MSAPILFPFDSLEDLFTSEMGFGVTTASKLQRAICWLLQGEQIPDELWGLEEVSDSFGGVRPTPGALQVVMLLCGIRCGKTLLCACAAVWAAFTVDLSHGAGIRLRPGEVPRVSVVSATTDNADETLKYITGAFLESPVLRAMLAIDPMVGDTVSVRHPSGHRVDIKVAAMSSKGVNLVSRWCASVIFDEAPRMASEDEGVINIKEQVSAVRLRLLRNAWIMFVGSPVGAKGYIYEQYEENWRKPEQKMVVIKAFSYRMNPITWTPAECKKAELADPDTYNCDVLANFRDPETQLFSAAVLDQCTRPGPLVVPFEKGKRYVAVMDPAATTNAWTFGIAESPDNRIFRVCYVAQWRGSKTEPLSPKRVLADIKPICDSYEVKVILSDQFMASAIIDIALDMDLGISPITVTQQNKSKMYLALLARAETAELELPPDPMVRRDFMNVKKRYSKGAVQIIPVETADGRHADYAAMLALLCGGYLDAYELDTTDKKELRSEMDDPYEALLEAELRGEDFDPMFDDPPADAFYYEDLY